MPECLRPYAIPFRAGTSHRRPGCSLRARGALLGRGEQPPFEVLEDLYLALARPVSISQTLTRRGCVAGPWWQPSLQHVAAVDEAGPPHEVLAGAAAEQHPAHLD